MTSDRPLVDAQTLTDLDAYIYEAVATLEQSGRPPTWAEIVAATDLDDETTSKILDGLIQHGVLVRAPSADGEGYELARHDWSNASDPASG
jgi:DNA-binding IclR family transcriptional regulator